MPEAYPESLDGVLRAGKKMSRIVNFEKSPGFGFLCASSALTTEAQRAQRTHKGFQIRSLLNFALDVCGLVLARID